MYSVLMLATKRVKNTTHSFTSNRNISNRNECAGEEVQVAIFPSQLLHGEAAHVEVKAAQLRVPLALGSAAPKVNHDSIHF